jgi:hypothetical protein
MAWSAPNGVALIRNLPRARIEPRLLAIRNRHPCKQRADKKMESLPNTVPRYLTPGLRAFCRAFTNSEPVFINSVPVQRAVGSFCFANVERKVRKSGGSIVYGWAIWHLPSFYYEAEHHAVWRNKFGNLIDVSPQFGGRRRILFLPDESAVYDPMMPRQNILAPAGSSPEAIEMTSLGNQRHSVYMRCRVPGTAAIQLFDADQIELALIDDRIRTLLNAAPPFSPVG